MIHEGVIYVPLQDLNEAKKVLDDCDPRTIKINKDMLAHACDCLTAVFPELRSEIFVQLSKALFG